VSTVTGPVVVGVHEEEQEEITVDASVSDEFAIDESAINNTLRTDVPLVDVPSTMPLARAYELGSSTVKSICGARRGTISLP
jgi:hypothetical protein